MKSSILLASLALATFAPATLAANAKVCFEAEGAKTIQSPIKKFGGQTKSKVSGGGYLEIPWDINLTKGLGQATYTFNVKSAGTYTVGARALWQNGCGNSVTVSVNGGPDKILGEDGLYEEWHWVGGRARVKSQLIADDDGGLLHRRSRSGVVAVGAASHQPA